MCVILLMVAFDSVTAGIRTRDVLIARLTAMPLSHANGALIQLRMTLVLVDLQISCFIMARKMRSKLFFYLSGISSLLSKWNECIELE